MLLMALHQQLADRDLQGATEVVERIAVNHGPSVIIQLPDDVAMDACYPWELDLEQPTRPEQA